MKKASLKNKQVSEYFWAVPYILGVDLFFYDLSARSMLFDFLTELPISSISFCNITFLFYMFYDNS